MALDTDVRNQGWQSMAESKQSLITSRDCRLSCNTFFPNQFSSLSFSINATSLVDDCKAEACLVVLQRRNEESSHTHKTCIGSFGEDKQHVTSAFDVGHFPVIALPHGISACRTTRHYQSHSKGSYRMHRCHRRIVQLPEAASKI